jgi:hypothetical protein
MTIIAYLDPGTGAMIIQALIAGIVGVGFAVKLFWGNIKSFCLKLAGKEVEACNPSCNCDSPDATGKDDDAK